VACPNFTSVLLVVVEVLCVENAVFVADQTIRSDHLRVHFYLDLYVFGDRHHVGASLFDQDLASLRESIDVGVVAVPMVGQFLQSAVFVVAHAKAKNGEKHPRLPLLLNQLDQITLVRRAHIEVPVGR
jgi:hypothetical protein